MITQAEQTSNPIWVTEWPCLTNPRGARREFTWFELVEWYSQRTQATFLGRETHPGISLATFRDDRRSKLQAEFAYCLALDFDHGASLDAIASVLTGLEFLVHTTRRHTPDDPRFRAVIPFSEPVDALKYASVWAAVAELFRAAGIVVDTAARDISRFWFQPGAVAPEHARLEVFAGDRLDPSVCIPQGNVKRFEPKFEIVHDADRNRDYALTALRKAAEKVASTQVDRNICLNSEVVSVARFPQLSDDEIIRSMHVAARVCGLEERETTDTIRSGLKFGRSQAPRVVPPPPAKDSEASQAGGSSTTSSSTPDSEWIDLSTTSDEDEPVPWICKALQICSGRPIGFIGNGGSLKTLAAQSLLMAAAFGLPIWGKFLCDCGRVDVVHFDYEQGRRATLNRYRKLARGLGYKLSDLPPDAFKVATLPKMKLNSKGARLWLINAINGRKVCVIDSLRNALPGEKEDDSSIGQWLELLLDVSSVTGCAIILIHHDTKPRAPKDGPRPKGAAGRGSGAIRNNMGAVWLFEGGHGEPRDVLSDKLSIEWDGETPILEGFKLDAVSANGGVVLTADLDTPITEQEPEKPKGLTPKQIFEAVRDALRMGGQMSENLLLTKVFGGRNRALVKSCLATMVEDKTIRFHQSPKRGEASTYSL